MKELICNIDETFVWKFYKLFNLPICEDKLPEQEKIKIFNSYNLGINKKHYEKILKQLEFFTRDEAPNFLLKIPLEIVPNDSPHHLDNENEIIGFDKYSFSSLIIKRKDEGQKIIEVNNEEITLIFDKCGIFALFTKLYINFKIYATFEDNIIWMKESVSNNDVRLVIWGVTNGKPIYY